MAAIARRDRAEDAGRGVARQPLDSAKRGLAESPQCARRALHAERRCLCQVGRHATRTAGRARDRKSTRLNSSHEWMSYAVFCSKKKTISLQLQRGTGVLGDKHVDSLQCVAG